MNAPLKADVREITHFHLFCGLGGGAKGFNRASARVGSMVGRFRCLGGVDLDPAAIRDFSRAAGVPGTVLDLFDREQFQAFHDREPGPDWREARPEDIRHAAGGEFPDIVFLSAPCKGFSGLLAEGRSKTEKYQALNRLTLRGVWLMLEAFADKPPSLIVFENVPRIASRGRALLDRITGLLRGYGYAVRETTHDCGTLGGLAQSRKRFLLVARHAAKVPPFLYEPPRRPLRGVGTVLERLPVPGMGLGGPMHRVPSLQWQTWVRLAFVEAGSDWRSLSRLAVEDGRLRDYLIVPEMHRGSLGVRAWDEPTGVVASRAGPTNGRFSVADPRFAAGGDYGQMGVRRWSEPSGTVTGQRSPIQGGFSVADPRHAGPAKHSNEFRIVPWNQQAGSVTGAHGTGQCVSDPRHYGPEKFHNQFRIVAWDKCAPAVTGAQGKAQCVADPRASSSYLGKGKYAVTGWGAPAGTIIGASATGHGAFAVADPRSGMNDRVHGSAYLTGGHYGVVPWHASTGAVSAAACHDNGPWSVSDPRLPEATHRLPCVIRALDGTWHRPFTTLELAALQSLVDPEETLELDGLSDSAWRERIGNAVPPDAAQAIAETMGTTLLLAWSGESFMLSSSPIWVRNVAIALSLDSPSWQ